MARRLVERFGGVAVWNRTASVAEPFAALGARVATSVTDVAAPVVLTVLPDLPQVESLVPALEQGWAERTIAEPTLVVHGTVSPVAVAAFAERLAARGIRVIDAPLSGGTIGADQGRLSVMVGGGGEDLDDVFGAYGTTIRHLGASGSGALAKLCNQVVVAATVTALGEAATLARHGGLDLGTVFELLGGGLANSEVLQQKGTRYVADDFAGGGSATNQLKDLRFVAESAAQLGLTLPVADAVGGLFARMVEDGDGALDHTGITRTLEQLAEGVA
jgi:2-hydroxy-3-oxopropionate reductase